LFRALTRATLLVIAPSAPVAWSPGTPPLTEALRARVLAGATSAAERAIEVLPVSGRRVVAVPVDAAMRWIIGTQPTTIEGRRAVPVGPGHAALVAPWGEPDPVPGVILGTTSVPATWLRPPTPTAAPVLPTAPTADVPRSAPLARPVARREPPAMPASMRLRKAAMMAFGLLVSLVAVEAAARVGRR
jgi:hypothetical protein